MTEEKVKFQFSKSVSSIIKVAGVGGGGCNAVNHMYEAGIKDVDYLVCNTDAQALSLSPVPVKIQLGGTLTNGLGVGNFPERGEEAAIENYDDIKKVLQENTKMLFITAGMGGGTGTGAAPVIARLAQELGILTIAVVTIPSRNEGKKRYNQAFEGILKLCEYTDSMLVVSNQRLIEIYGDLPARQAFKLADDIVTAAVKGVAEIITLPGIINIDFADVNTVMHDSKVFIMGTGYASGENRAQNAVEMALQSPLLDNNDIRGTKKILVNMISGTDEIRMGEIGKILDLLQTEAGSDADIIWGNGYDDSIGDKISVTILCTGFRDAPAIQSMKAPAPKSFKLAEDTIEAEPERKVTVPADPQPRILELDPDTTPLKGDHQPTPPNQKVEEKKSPPKPQPSNDKNRKPETGSTNLDTWFFKKFHKYWDEDEKTVP
jgi:cell division protein FtsZ